MADPPRPDDLPDSEVRLVRRILILAAFAVLAAAIWFLSDVLLLTFAGVLLAVLVRSISTPLKTKLRVSEGVALSLSGAVILVVLVSGLALFGAQIAGQFNQLLTVLPEAANRILAEFGVTRVQDMLTGTAVGNVLTTAYEWTTAIVSIATALVFVIFTGIYLALDPIPYRNGFILLFPPRVQPLIEETVDDAGRALSLWIGGQLIAMLMVGVMTALGLWLIGLNSALALGFIAGLADFVPIVGPITAAIPGLLVASGQGFDMVLWTLAVYVIVQQIESNIIVPIVVGNAVKIPPALGLFAVIALGVLFGPLGVLFAYPLAVVADVAVRRLYIRETLGEKVEISGEEK
ncbi:MAG TPA: AI-2E family transporter [Hyphomicrobiaceae bacterium]